MTDTTVTDPIPDAPLTADQEAMLADLLAQKAAAEAKAARETALTQLDGVADALNTMMGPTCLGVLRAAA